MCPDATIVRSRIPNVRRQIRCPRMRYKSISKMFIMHCRQSGRPSLQPLSSQYSHSPLMHCERCGWYFKELARFVRHYFIMQCGFSSFRVTHIPDEATPSEQKGPCRTCGIHFPNDAVLVSHCNEKHGLTPDNS